ncbi:MAG: pentapeptide repeat-containing protein, partial [Hyphomicrobiaceae bacterium]
MSYVDQTENPGEPVNPDKTSASQSPVVAVNPYSLLEAVNASSMAARGGWVLFLAIATFILIAVAGVTHRDLLLNTKVDLPILQVEIELTRFFLFAPILLLFVHFGMLIQHVMLARKTLEFDKSLRAMEATRKPAHPLRLELHSYFFTQALAGPQRGWLLAGFLHMMIWISLVVLPVLIILFTQVVFLPYHDETITWVHRIVLSIDMLILIAVGVFLRRTEASFFSALARAARHHPANFFVTGTLFAVVLLFSYLVATIPGETLDRLRPKGPATASTQKLTGTDGQQNISVAAIDFLSSSQEFLQIWLDGVVSRNLIVTDVDDLTSGSGDDTTEDQDDFRIILRDRKLENAILDRSDLRRADLAGADLTGASLQGTDLRMARFTCTPDKCGKLDGANLNGANLDGADFKNASLVGATFVNASLHRINFSAAHLIATDFSGADLRRAKFTDWVSLVGANFLDANLRGAYLSGANLSGADLGSAKMQGAIMQWVIGIGANFSRAELDGAFMQGVHLQGANLDNVTMLGTDMTGAAIWQTRPPNPLVFRLT